MRTNIKDSFRFLTAASAVVGQMSKDLEAYLSKEFKNVKQFYSRKNIFGQLIFFMKDLTQLIMYYISKSTTENNVITAQGDVSLRHFAELTGYIPTRYIAATGSVRIHFNPSTQNEIGNTLLVRKYATFKNKINGLQYLVDIGEEHKMIIVSKSEVILPVIQGQIKEQTFIANGNDFFTINLDDTDTVEDTHIKISVGNEVWTRALNLSEMSLNSKHFLVRTGYGNQIDIIFGTELRGGVPKNGEQITVQYITCSGELGNLDNTVEQIFQPVSGFFTQSGEEAELNDICTVKRENGFYDGSYGDSKETIRSMVGYNDRTMVLADARNYEAFLAKYSTLSRVMVWSPYDNPNIKCLLLFPNLKSQLVSNKSYISMNIDKFFLTKNQKAAIVDCIKNSGKSYQNHELHFIDPKIRKYAVSVYIEPGSEEIEHIKNKTDNAIIEVFVNATFDKFPSRSNLNIVKADIVKAIREALPLCDSISLEIVSAEAEDAKFNGFYYEYSNEWDSQYAKRESLKINVDKNGIVTTLGSSQYGDMVHIGLSENNDIVSESFEIVPALRGGFRMYGVDENGNPITYANSPVIDDPIMVHAKINNSWNLLTH